MCVCWLHCYAHYAYFCQVYHFEGIVITLVEKEQTNYLHLHKTAVFQSGCSKVIYRNCEQKIFN